MIVLALLSGCGDGETANRRRGSGQTAVGEDEEGDRALQNIPPADRLAFVQLGVAAGNLRSSAALLKVKDVLLRRDTVTLQRLRKNVESLAPRDPLLRRIRRWTLTELEQAIKARRSLTSARRSAEATLSGVDRIVGGLRAYVFVHPEVGALVPE